MAGYLLIESRDPFDANDVANFYDLAEGLVRDGSEVTLFLVQNGVLPARQGSRSKALASVAAAGVEVLADEFSLRERGIPSDRLVSGVTPAPLDTVVDQLAEGRKALWH
jgi:predicted peroxiredoxin